MNQEIGLLEGPQKQQLHKLLESLTELMRDEALQTSFNRFLKNRNQEEFQTLDSLTKLIQDFKMLRSAQSEVEATSVGAPNRTRQEFSSF